MGPISDRGVSQRERFNVDLQRDIEDILRFGREHRDGSYLVVFGDMNANDARAISQYLGAQGNQTLLSVFREASPNALFFYPQVNAFSGLPDNFGISSALADDTSFRAQPYDKHVERALQMGVRYILLTSEELADRLKQEPYVKQKYVFGFWNLLELSGTPPPAVRPLENLPALVLTDFSVKRRRRNEHNFIRFAEEQFADGWFDVMLAYAPSRRLEELGDSELANFGAVLVEDFDCRDCDRAFERLRAFGRQRPLILYRTDAPLFKRLEASAAEFPALTVIERNDSAGPGEWMENYNQPTYDYNQSPLRGEWAQIRAALESHKTPAPAYTVTGSITDNEVSISGGGAQGTPVPVLVRVTYYPNWRRDDDAPLYITTPAHMLTFVDRPVSIRYVRKVPDTVALYASAATLVGLFGFALFYGRWRAPIELPVSEPKVTLGRGSRS